MSPDAVQRIAADIAQQMPFNWYYFVILGLLTLVSSSVGALVGSYMKKRGEQRAYTADFNEIKEQLQETTRAQETIRAEVKRMSERSERLEWMKREKLEHYVESATSLLNYMKEFSTGALYKDGYSPGPHPIATANMLFALYLPELAEVHGELSNSVTALHDIIQEGLKQRTGRQALPGIANSPIVYEVPAQVLERYSAGLDRLLEAYGAVIKRAAEVAGAMNNSEN